MANEINFLSNDVKGFQSINERLKLINTSKTKLSLMVFCSF